MANLTVENIGGLVRQGNIERALEGGRQIESPLSPTDSGVAGKSFGQLLNDSLEKVNDMQLQADRGAKELVAGRNKNIHETMLLMEQADMSYRLAMQVRNKVIEAYREIMRMQV